MAAIATSAAAGEAKLAAAHQLMMRTAGLQHVFARAPAPSPPPPWLTTLARLLMKAAPVFQILFWVGVAAAVAVILWVVVRDLPLGAALRRRRRGEPSSQADWRPDAGAALALLDEADRLAKAGRFDEAIHLILFRSIADIAARRPGLVRDALTSRDLVNLAPLSERGREAFRLITQAVERSYFGGQAADADDFARCRSRYEAFALAEGG